MRTTGRIRRFIGSTLLAGSALLLALPLFVGAQEKPAKALKPAPAPTASYVGSAACKACHGKMWDSWPASAHGKALSATGLPAEMTACESCHGPASLHISVGSQVHPSIPKADDAKAANAVCGACHFPSDTSKALKAWQNIAGGGFTKSAHGRHGLACVSCHAGHPNGNDKQLIKPSPALCLKCHGSLLESSPGKKAAYTHTPVAQGLCLTCHDPHGTPSRDMIVPNVEKACLTCHDAKAATMVTAHKGYPVADSKCAQCHNPHSHDKNAKLVKTIQHAPFKSGNCEICHTKPVAGKPAGLVKPVKELCLSCHPASVMTPEGQHAHVPAKEGLCTTCHSPHVSTEKALMKQRAAYACFSCHGKIEDATVSEYRHKVLETNLDCMICHKPHSSSEDKLQIKDEMTLCGQCHKHAMSHPMGHRADGSVVMNPTSGTPLICSSCHDIHGSKFAAHTKADKSKDLCVQCHGKVGH